MKWKPFLHKNIRQTGICVLLCAAILLGLLLPSCDLVEHRPENPLADAAIADITVLNVGENVSELSSIVIPNGGSDSPTEPDETTPENLQPEQMPTEKPVPEEDPEDGDENEGNSDGNQGEEGGDGKELDLAAVMTWYKYGKTPQSVTCDPSASVSKTVNTAQLEDSILKYAFTLGGEDSRYAEITEVTVAAGDGGSRRVKENGSVEIELPGGNGDRNYTFCLRGYLEKPDKNGEALRQEVTFTFVLKCEYDLDLELNLIWHPKNRNERSIVCSADRTEAFTVKNQDLTERVFAYSVELDGSLAAGAEIISAQYTTASGQKNGSLQPKEGTLILDPEPGRDTETYNITFTVRTSQRDVLFHYMLTYQETLDVQLSFHWMERGTIRQTKLCDAGKSTSLRIKNNQLSAGAIPYELELTGKDGADGRILSVAYTSAAGGSGNLEPSGALPMSMAAGESSNFYRVTVSALVKGQRIGFEIVIHYSSDMSLQMEYTVLEEGAAVTRQIVCENTRSKTAEAVYDDQLDNGMLSYTVALAGSEGEQAAVTSVTCYQSGSGKTVTLGAEGQVELLLKNGKTGENTFEIEAEDAADNVYRFTVNIPYKHRGENNIQIKTNLTDGQQIINGTKTNLTVEAWSEDANGNVTGYIPANGTDTRLTVQFDGETVSYTSSSGAASEYDLFPKNPDVGDTNTHTLYIYAEDAYGNYGEVTLTLQGLRREPGQQIGKASIYVDMSVLGLGVVANLSYDVLADEPVSYVIAKAVMGIDTGEPFGAAADNLGWGGRYAGTLDNGFYLQSLTTGHTANALEDSSWPGTAEADVLQAIDNRFGAGTGLASLWRCLYRNGLNKSTGSGNSFGEFDYTSGSGWMYSVGGATYYPGQSMSGVYLQDGDVLTLRYTLAYGWDVGGGSPGYGSTVGYCVSAVNGSIRVDHRMETVQTADGTVSAVCRCCGIVEDCVHANVAYLQLDGELHIRFCSDCQKEIGDPEEHGWYSADTDHQHSCAACGAAEAHTWREIDGSNTASCTEGGTRSIQCVVCSHITEEETGPKGHTLDNQWLITAENHYEKCSTCGQTASEGYHQYQLIAYLENGVQYEDYECRICHAFHIDECDGTLVETDVTCQNVTCYCGSCGYSLSKAGYFPENHYYTDGICEYCGAMDPNGAEPEPAPEPDPEPEQPPEPEEGSDDGS